MSHDAVYNEQILTIAQNASSYVTTVLVCQNSLIRSGLSHILSGTRFVLSDEAQEHPSELPILCLIHANQIANDLIGTVEKLKAQWPSARVVFLTERRDPAATAQALRAGLDGLFSSAMDRAALIKALELVMLGETFVSAAAGLALLEQRQAASPADAGGSAVSAPANDFASVSSLSGREAQILHFLTKGASNKLTARDLGVAEATVKVHLKAILRKVKAANRTQAAIWAQQHMNRATNETPIAAE